MRKFRSAQAFALETAFGRSGWVIKLPTADPSTGPTLSSHSMGGAIAQYLIPGVQLGAKVQVDAASGEVVDVFSVVRPVTPDNGCVLCNQLINASKLRQESISEEDHKRQRYVDEPDVVAPSVITLNATAASQTANDFLFYATGLRHLIADAHYMRFQPRFRQMTFDEPRRSSTCPDCGLTSKSRLARGDARRLPVIQPPQADVAPRLGRP